ncbi:MAG: tolB [Frankiales bacterium]|nr:tolB [Frankiales bacterium]
MFTENADGTDLKPLSPETGGEGPRFSPDGHRIAFALTIHDRVVGVVINADGTGYHAFAPPKGTLNMPCTVWSPDARRLACEGFDDKHPAGEGMYTVEAANGGDVRRVTNHHDIPCAYSPDGAQLLFLRYNPADETRNQLMVVNAKGGTPRLIRKDVDLSCDWSPDGKHLLSEAEGKLLLIDLRGASTVIPIAIRKASRGSFSPDGKHLIFSGSVGDKEDIYTVNIDGSELVQITSTPSQDEEFGDWGPGAVS